MNHTWRNELWLYTVSVDWIIVATNYYGNQIFMETIYYGSQIIMEPTIMETNYYGEFWDQPDSLVDEFIN